LDLQEALSKEEEPLPIIFLTAHGDVADDRASNESGRGRFPDQTDQA
jgi:FixJ family two-component response regulator